MLAARSSLALPSLTVLTVLIALAAASSSCGVRGSPRPPATLPTEAPAADGGTP